MEQRSTWDMPKSQLPCEPAFARSMIYTEGAPVCYAFAIEVLVPTAVGRVWSVFAVRRSSIMPQGNRGSYR